MRGIAVSRDLCCVVAWGVSGVPMFICILHGCSCMYLLKLEQLHSVKTGSRVSMGQVCHCIHCIRCTICIMQTYMMIRNSSPKCSLCLPLTHCSPDPGSTPLELIYCLRSCRASCYASCYPSRHPSCYPSCYPSCHIFGYTWCYCLHWQWQQN